MNIKSAKFRRFFTSLPQRSLRLVKKSWTNPLSRFYIIAVLTEAVLIAYLFSEGCEWFSGGSLLLALIDAITIFTPLWFIKRRRWSALIPIWLTAIFVQINVMMVRWNGDLLSFHSVFMTDNVDNEVTDNLPYLTHFVDFIMWGITLGFTIYYFIEKRRIRAIRVPKRIKWKGLVYSLFIFLIGQAICTVKYHAYKGCAWDEAIGGRTGCDTFTLTRDLRNNGLVVYSVKSIISIYESRQLSDDELSEIDTFLISRSKTQPTHKEFLRNHDKNLILIVVESLNAHAITDSIGSHPIMPTLNALLNKPGTISCLNVVTQYRGGGSGDGQMLITAGLLPIHQGSAAMRYGPMNQFVTLCDYFPHYKHRYAFFADDGILWREKRTFKNYKFDEVFINKDFIPETEKYGSDGAMLNLAISKADSLSQPFFLECMTLNTHAPFTSVKSRMPEWIAQAGLSERVTNYLNSCNYLDNCLKTFFNKLKNLGLWNNSIIVIVSDHSVKGTIEGVVENNVRETPMTFIALNTGINAKINRTVGQVDLFPTLLDILGITPDMAATVDINGQLIPYFGLGRSILNEDVAGAVNIGGGIYGNVPDERYDSLLNLYDISHNIIQGDYFKLRPVHKANRHNISTTNESGSISASGKTITQ